MKKLYDLLGIAAWSFVGVFLGSSIYTFYDYKTRPGLRSEERRVGKEC